MSVCMLLSLCACGKSDNKKSNSKKSSDESNITDTYEDNPSFEAPEDNTENFTTTTTKPAVKLSASCSKVLCSGSNGSDYYDLVANQIDGYPDSTFEFGVIKNNQWLVPMGSDCPFIDENGWWAGAAGYANQPGKFDYIGAGCFYYDTRTTHILYNPETNFSFNVWGLCNNGYGGNATHKYAINENSEIFVRIFDPDHEYKHPLYYVNMTTGQTKYLPLDTSDLEIIGCFSDNLFFAALDTDIHHNGNEVVGFYDLDGNQIIDLSTYLISDYKDFKFTNGQYTFTAKNNSNVFFDITIDTTGKIINQEKTSN